MAKKITETQSFTFIKEDHDEITLREHDEGYIVIEQQGSRDSVWMTKDVARALSVRLHNLVNA